MTEPIKDNGYHSTMELSNNQLLRFTTAGSVDDGKSTLIGRLLFDSKSIFEDQLDQVTRTSMKKGHEGVDLALFTDGLRDEREQGITIDVAYRYFTTPKRKFIIADTPGHIQYTRNMVTGASTANAAIVLVDARHGVVEQTKRHIFIAHLLGIPHIVVCVNKMDLVDYSEDRFYEVAGDIKNFTTAIEKHHIDFIPISALKGDNVVKRSTRMPWFKGQPLLSFLEEIDLGNDTPHNGFRFPVQTVIRPQTEAYRDYRGYAGRVAGEAVEVGHTVKILPGGHTSRVSEIYRMDKKVEKAASGESVVLCIEDDIDISRGDMLVSPKFSPREERNVEAVFCWMNDHPMQGRTKYVVRHTSGEALGMVQEVSYKLNINTLEKIEDDSTIEMNDIFKGTVKLNKAIYTDPYKENRATGSFILIDPGTNQTVAAAMVV